MRARRSLILAATLVAIAPATASASHGEPAFFEAPGILVGAPASVQQRTLATLQSLGVRALRVTLYWRDVAPMPNRRHRPAFHQANPAAYDWSAYDPLIGEATALHWTVLLTVTGPVPDWATPHGEDRYSDPSTGDFRQFMEAVGRHYGATVKLISIWNEPNQPGFLRPQFVHGRIASAAIYRGLFLAGYAGLEASGHFAGMRVLMGETSAVGTAGVPAPLAFLRALLCLNAAYRPVGHCAKLPAYGYAQHPYTNSRGPFGRPPPDDVTIATLGRLVSALDRAAAAGAIRPDMPIFITEFGIQSYPNPVVGVPLRQQAEFDAISERIAYENPRVASFSQYLLRDDHPVRGRVVGFQSGLETWTGAKKPSFAAFRLPLTVTRTAGGVAFWGLVRPARRPTTVVVQYSTDGGRRWHGLASIRTDARGYWQGTGVFARGRVWRVEWGRFAGPPIRAYTAAGRIAS